MEIIKPPRGVQLDKSHPLNRGLVACFLFNEGDGKKVFDLSGNGNHGTLTNMAFPPTAASGWNAGRKGVGLSFDGTDDYVDCGNDSSLDITDAITVEAWVKINISSNSAYILAKQYGSTIIPFYFDTRNKRPAFGTYHNSTSYEARMISDISLNEWHHIVGIFDKTLPSDNLKIYVDSILKDTENHIDPLPTNTTDLHIGKYSTNEFTGQIDQVRIYSRALTASEILYLYLHSFG